MAWWRGHLALCRGVLSLLGGFLVWEWVARYLVKSTLIIVPPSHVAVALASSSGWMVAEFFGTRAGLGYLILVSSQLFDTSALFVAVVIPGRGRRPLGDRLAEARAMACPVA